MERDVTILGFTCRCRPASTSGFNDSVAIERGPLVYALKIGAEWKKVKDNPPVRRLGGLSDDPLELRPRDRPRAPGPIGDLRGTPRWARRPFSVEGAPVVATVKGRRLPGWGIEKGGGRSAAAEPGAERRTARGADADPLWLHRPADHRVPDAR